MVSLSMTLSVPWPMFQGHGSFKRRISPKRRVLPTQLLYRTLIGHHRHAIDRQAIYSLQPHCSYINRADVSQASRGFVSDSWPFLLYSDTQSIIGFLIQWSHFVTLNESFYGFRGKSGLRRETGEIRGRFLFSSPEILQESPPVADKPARRLRKVCTVYVRAVHGCKLYS